MNAAIRPGSLRAWCLAARPATLSAAFAPVCVGSAVAQAVDAFRWGPALAALFGAMWIQIGTNFANDVFDYQKGTDTEARVGFTRAAQAGLLKPRQLKAGMLVSFSLATLCGVYLTSVAGWPVVAIGIASIVSGIAYTGGPYPLGYHGLGDIFVMIFFGFVAVCGTVYVQALHVPALAWWAALALGSLVTAILVVNNIRDAAGDAQTNKRTLVVLWGRRFGIAEYALLLGVAMLVPGYLWISGLASIKIAACWVTLPRALWLLWRLVHAEGAALNPLLGATAKLLLVYSVIFSLALIL